ncbi:MAG: helicase C-terminal domain-containing protein [Nanoarchaeota archaeon]
MWSLYKKNSENSEGIFDFSGEKLPPRRFSNGKTQEDIINEILEAISKGNKIIFINGVCGSGKSAIALNLARNFKKTSIVVPIKSLQEQYEHDYMHEKFLLKENNQKLKISIIKGRNNFKCPFSGERADNAELPCTIEIKDKNFDQIKRYIELNDNALKEELSSISDVRRMSIAPSCPYWSPILPSDVSTKALEKSKKSKYESISGSYALFQRKKGCAYYDQYEAYPDSDVLIFNSQKYLLETIIGRKPKTELDIIDECDEFLDNFATEKTINLNRLFNALSNLFPDTNEKKQLIKELIFQINELVLNFNTNIEKISDTAIMDLILKILENPHLAEDEEENYYNNVFEIAKSFENVLEESYVSTLRKKDSNGRELMFLNLVSINLAKRFQDLLETAENIVLMSGTLHSEKVLKDIFGLNNFRIINAETKSPGIITKYRTGFEKNCKYENFKSGLVSRKDYLRALSNCIKNAKPPILIHVNSFEDLPTELEKEEYNLDNVITKERLIELQERDRDNLEVEKFKSGKINILFTTKCSRGMDFPGDKCNSIILTKYPYPNIRSLFWEILKKEQPEKFMEFYLDKAKRELLQKIYRGLRSKDDHVILLSPDSRVLDARFN